MGRRYRRWAGEGRVCSGRKAAGHAKGDIAEIVGGCCEGDREVCDITGDFVMAEGEAVMEKLGGSRVDVRLSGRLNVEVALAPVTVSG